MAVLIAVPAHQRLGEGFTPRERLAAREHPGRRTDGTQSAATWIDHLVALRRPVLLCTFCRVKFNPRRHQYRKFYAPDAAGKTDGYVHNGRCDACKQSTELLPGGGTLFIAEEAYRLLCLDPREARRKARAAAGAQTAWQRISLIFTRASRGAREAATGKGA